jgi:V/A-type H+-transporting ATPase subunit K
VAISRKTAIIILIAVAITAASLAVATVSPIAAAQGDQAGKGGASGVLGKTLGAGLAVGLAGIGGGYAVGVAGAAAMSAIAEKREVSGMGLLIVAMGEGIAIYGLLVAILLIFVVH